MVDTWAVGGYPHKSGDLYGKPLSAAGQRQALSPGGWDISVGQIFDTLGKAADTAFSYANRWRQFEDMSDESEARRNALASYSQPSSASSGMNTNAILLIAAGAGLLIYATRGK
ncbi:MAG: hypothetical protein AAFR28_15365 [Pseudomonadota bacterium]